MVIVSPEVLQYGIWFYFILFQRSTPPAVLLLPLYHIQCFISIREFVERCHLINIFKGPCFSKYFKIKKEKSHYNCPRRPGQSSDKGAKLVNDKLRSQQHLDFIFLLQFFQNCFILFIYPSECQTPMSSLAIFRSSVECVETCIVGSFLHILECCCYNIAFDVLLNEKLDGQTLRVFYIPQSVRSQCFSVRILSYFLK